MLFDRICRENAITHRLTRPASPTTTGKVERFHQTLRRELLNDHRPFASITEAQAAIDVFLAEYNGVRPHQTLDMQRPTDRFIPRPVDEELPLRIPALLESTEADTTPGPEHRTPAPTVVLPTRDTAGEVADLAVEITRVIPASGNLTVCGQQFWLGPTNAGMTIGLWADTTVIHLLLAGVRLKTVPSRLTTAHLRQLLADGGHPAGPPPIITGTIAPGASIEVDRLVNANGLITLAGRQLPIGSHYAGQRVTVRLDRGLMQITSAGMLLRSLPNPLTTSDLARLRDARPAGPPPQPAAEPLRVDRRVSTRGTLVVAGQKIAVGLEHAGKTLTVEATDTTFRVFDADQLLTETGRTTNREVARFKVRKPHTPRAAAR